ncbi:Rv3235 family protein [Nocardia carnea]|uniref:Rv3235 family protein n=1 Tax=Nocardia carnea TaxID=37328 RepID=UPI0024571FD0|nr:Rv3235 family protein [Nocardia carnea]
MRDVRPMLYRVPEYEPPAELPGGLPRARPRASISVAGQSSPRIPHREGNGPAAPVPAERESGAATPAPACAPVKTAADSVAGCRPRIARGALRSGSRVPASLRRVQRAAHAAERSDRHLDAREFTGTTLRFLLETLDRRRPVAQLAKSCTPALVHAIGSLVAGDHVPSRTLGAAVLAKYQLFPVAGDAFELVAMYDRGPRRLALAGRVEHTTTGWKVTALRLA